MKVKKIFFILGLLFLCVGCQKQNTELSPLENDSSPAKPEIIETEKPAVVNENTQSGKEVKTQTIGTPPPPPPPNLPVVNK